MVGAKRRIMRSDRCHRGSPGRYHGKAFSLGPPSKQKFARKLELPRVKYRSRQAEGRIWIVWNKQRITCDGGRSEIPSGYCNLSRLTRGTRRAHPAERNLRRFVLRKSRPQ